MGHFVLARATLVGAAYAVVLVVGCSSNVSNNLPGPTGGGAVCTCPDGSACNNGSCAAMACAMGQTACGGACIDTSQDPAHCGACGTTCDASSICRTGKCLTVDLSLTQWKMPPDVPPDTQYSVSVDGATVSDAVTGLVWQRNAVNKIWTQYAFADVASHCRSLDYGGYSSGWRAPTVIELVSILDFSIPSWTPPQMLPLINPRAFPNSPAYVWSGSPSATPSLAWYVIFGDAYVDLSATNPNDVYETYAVRCVRGGKLPANVGQPRYATSSGVVTDTVTGLHWQQQAPPQKATWAGAGAYCASLTLGAFTSGWRLPGEKELVSLVQWKTFSGPTIDSNAFPGAMGDHYWSSLAVAGSTQGGRWFVNFGGSGVTNSDVAMNLYVDPNQLEYVRCVHD